MKKWWIIGQRAFQGCTALKSVVLSESLVELDSNVFDGCTNLTTIELSAGISKIGYGAFTGCDNLTTVNFKGTEAEWLALVAKVNSEALNNAKVNYLA